MTTTEVAALADGQRIGRFARSLPPAQRSAIRRDGAYSLVVARRLAKHGLVSFYTRQTGENWIKLEFTPLGLAVRAHLLASGGA